MIRYAKLRDGTWGLRADEGATLFSGETVTVTRKDGDTRTETVGRVLWQGNGAAIATIRRSAGSGTGHGAGERCAECQERRAVTTATDSSGISGPVCSQCARLAPYDRSFA